MLTATGFVDLHNLFCLTAIRFLDYKMQSERKNCVNRGNVFHSEGTRNVNQRNELQ